MTGLFNANAMIHFVENSYHDIPGKARLFRQGLAVVTVDDKQLAISPPPRNEHARKRFVKTFFATQSRNHLRVNALLVDASLLELKPISIDP